MNRLRAVVVAAVMLVARAASAELSLEGSEDADAGRYHSPQRFAAQLTFGPFRPDVDSEFSSPARHPFADYFGTDRRLLSQLEVDYQLFQRMGSAAVGLGVGFFHVTGNSPAADHTGPSGDTSTLTLVPVTLSAVYRFDYYLRKDNFPLVPHAKLGLDWTYWQITDGNGDIADDHVGGHARGGTLGWHAALGLALVIDMLDPEAARGFDNEMGVNHTALVFEYGHYDVSGLFESNRLHVGDTTWTLGLLFEF